MHYLPRRLLWLCLGSSLMLFVAACSTPTPGSPSPAATMSSATPSPAPNLASATPAPTATPPASARETLDRYLADWMARDYGDMYPLLALASQATYTEADFVQVHETNYITMTATALTATVTSFSETADTAQAAVHLNYATVLVGELPADITVTLQRSDRWGVDFTPALVWPDLVNGQQLYMVPFAATRGNLYDRNGVALTEETQVYAVGFVPDEILPEDIDLVITGLSRLSGLSIDDLNRIYQNAVIGHYQPITQAPADLVEKRYAYLLNKPGVYFSPYTSRYYPLMGEAAFLTGYVSALQPDEAATLLAAGYSPAQLIGRSGLEKWGETLLAGHNGGQLVLLNAGGQPLRVLSAAVGSTDGQDIYTTVAVDFQQAVQFALGDMTGAIVVLNQDTGEVLALASNPTYDPNRFNPEKYNHTSLSEYFNDPREPLIDRAAQSAFPAGSIFKIVTMASGMTAGLFQPDSVYECTGEWSEAGPTAILKDWTIALELPPHGNLTLTEGLSASCNPWFWHIGYALFKKDPGWESVIARQFGLGQATSIGQVSESPGQIPDPDWMLKTQGRSWEPLDSLNMAIGQGDVLVTPLQIARLVAAVGNGGTLYQPQLVSAIRPLGGGEPSFVATPLASGTLSLTVEELTAIQTGMINVTKGPIGTARNRFRNLPGWLKIAGKTGTAEDPGYYGTQQPHSWFVGYTMVDRPNQPDIAVAVVVQNQGQGSEFAAPIFRRVVESYFGINLTKYPWESSVGVVKTPEPTPVPGSETPTPTP